MDPKPPNFAELAKSVDRNRVEFLATEVQATWTLLRLAETEQRIGNVEQAARSRQHAEQGYRTLTRMLADEKHRDHMTEEDHRRFSAEAERLRQALDGLEAD